jgi:hypothetical protein
MTGLLHHNTGPEDTMSTESTKTGIIMIWTGLIIAVFLTLTPLAGAAEDNGNRTVVSGAAFDNALEIGPERLELVGAGLLRYMIVIRAYAAALYLGEGHSAEELFDDIPKCLVIDYFHNLPADGFIKATQYGLEANLTPEELEKLGPQIKRLYACYTDIKKHDRYSFIYTPGSGAELELNGETLCRFDDLAFANAVLSIWLGRNPLDKLLKKELLGLQ